MGSMKVGCFLLQMRVIVICVPVGIIFCWCSREFQFITAAKLTAGAYRLVSVVAG